MQLEYVSVLGRRLPRGFSEVSEAPQIREALSDISHATIWARSLVVATLS